MLAKVLLFTYVLSTLFMYIATSCPILYQLNGLHVKSVCNSQFDWLCVADACKGTWPAINGNILAAGEN